MSNTAGVVRFLLFVAIIALLAGGYYANNLRTSVNELKTVRTDLIAERDALQTKVNDLTKSTADLTAKLQEAQGKIAELEKTAQAAAKPRGRSR